ncbi:glycosyltransferase family 2 protein [Megalodesulfovibrio paquesii]
MHYLSLCIIVKDEGRAIREWVAHHALLGVEHFYIFDNESQEPVPETLRDFPQHLFSFASISGQQMQIPAYRWCLQEHGANNRWIGFLDADEFLFPCQGQDLRPVLAEFEPYAGLAVPWTMFGASGHETRPQGTLMESYLHRYPEYSTGWHKVIKCLVDPSRIERVDDPHRFFPVPGQHLVTEHHLPVTPGSNQALRSCTRLQLNHYFFKSREDWDAKLARGRADRADEQSRYPVSMFEHQARHATQLDKSILRFLPGVLRALRTPASLAAVETGPLLLHEAVRRCMTLLQHPQPDRKALEEAGALLCRAAADPVQSKVACIWLMRAMMARVAGQLEQARRFALQALLREESAEVFLELVTIARASGQRDDARAALLCLTHAVRDMQDQGDWPARLAETTRQVEEMAG